MQVVGLLLWPSQSAVAMKELTSAFSNTDATEHSSSAPATPVLVAGVVPQYRPFVCPSTLKGLWFAWTVRYSLASLWSERRAFRVNLQHNGLLVRILFRNQSKKCVARESSQEATTYCGLLQLKPFHWNHAVPPAPSGPWNVVQPGGRVAPSKWPPELVVPFRA